MTKYVAGQVLKVHGKDFIVVAVKKFFPFGVTERHALTLRKPRGNKTYELVVYENGNFSSIV
jgi:hypothetical protein